MTASTSSYSEVDPPVRWAGWRMTALERVRLPYTWLVLIWSVAAAAAQVFEYLLRDPGFRLLGADIRGGLVFVALNAYILLYLGLLKQRAVAELAALRPAVQVDDALYDRQARRTLHADWRVEALILLASAVLWVLIILVLSANELLAPARAHAGGLLMLGFILLSYVLLSWLALALIYTTIRCARGLGALAHSPLVVNVFDPRNLLPFGRLSLLYSIAPAGLVLIPLIALGRPTQMAGFLIIGFSVVSLLLLFVPLWGVHRQMVRARDAVLGSIHERLMGVQDTLLSQADVDAAGVKLLTDSTTIMVNLRKLIVDAPSWPFKSEAAVVRAILATTSPLIYFALNQFLLTLLSPLLKK
jgi:hypothetical protein